MAVRISLQTEGAQKSVRDIDAVTSALDKLQSTPAGLKGIPLGQLSAKQQLEVLGRLGIPVGGQQVNIAHPITTSPSAGGGGINWRQVGLGLAATPFSPWVGARALSSSGLFGGAGGGGSGGLFGPGGFSGFLGAFAALQVVTHGLRFAFEQLREAVKRGSDIFVKSAGLGVKPELFAHLQNALTVAGLGPETAERLLANAQFGRGVKLRPSDIQGAAQLGAGRGILSREELQAILNMSVQVADAWNRTLVASRLSAELSTRLRESDAVKQTATKNWEAIWEAASAVFHTKFLNPLRRGENWVLEQQNKLNTWLLERQGIAVPGPQNQKFGLGQGSLSGRPESGWEKMGLVIAGGVGGTDFARQTAHNTKRIADLLQMNKGMHPETPSSPNTYNHLG